MSERNIGYVVVEFNQASGQPGFLDFPHIHNNHEDAAEEAARMQRSNRQDGRRERYAVGTVAVEEEE